MSVNIQTSSGLVKIAGTPTVDIALSNVSKNPVQNKVITEKFDEINSDVDGINRNLDNLKVSEIAGGKNLTDKVKYSSTSNNYLPLLHGVGVNLKEGTVYTASVELTASSSTQAYWNEGSGIFNTRNCSVSPGTKRYSYTFTALKDTTYSDSMTLLSKSATSDGVTISSANFQIEEGSTSTPYEPYIPSVKNLSEEVAKQNASLDAYGLDNKVTVMVQGQPDSTDPSDAVNRVSTDYIPCNANDIITYKHPNETNYALIITFYNSSKSKISSVASSLNAGQKEISAKAPTNTSYVVGTVALDTYRQPTPSNAGENYLYVNNAIDDIKDTLGGLKFSVSDGTLSITDGTKTWTLS